MQWVRMRAPSGTSAAPARPMRAAARDVLVEERLRRLRAARRDARAGRPAGSAARPRAHARERPEQVHRRGPRARRGAARRLESGASAGEVARRGRRRARHPEGGRAADRRRAAHRHRSRSPARPPRRSRRRSTSSRSGRTRWSRSSRAPSRQRSVNQRLLRGAHWAAGCSSGGFFERLEHLVEGLEHLLAAALPEALVELLLATSRGAAVAGVGGGDPRQRLAGETRPADRRACPSPPRAGSARFTPPEPATPATSSSMVSLPCRSRPRSARPSCRASSAV